MATIASPPCGEQPVIFHDVPWQTYASLLAARGEGRVRLTYYHGVLEIMTLSKLHEILSELLDNFVKVLVKEHGLEVQSVGSMTMHAKELQSGAEADKAYYIRHEEVVRERDEYDPASDPPPDLAVEVDLSSSSARRLRVFAELGIPEVWRYDGQRLAFMSLDNDGQYHASGKSLSFPAISAADLEAFVDRRGTVGEIVLDEELAKWVRATLNASRP